MASEQIPDILSQDVLDTLFPSEKTDAFFDALFGDVSEGAYDIRLALANHTTDRINLEYLLSVRPGKCLVCSLTSGLPNVFLRHPVIGIEKLVAQLTEKLKDTVTVTGWHLGETRTKSSDVHAITLTLDIC